MSEGVDSGTRPGRCYLCRDRHPKDHTEIRLHAVPSGTRGGTVEGVKRYVRMCCAGHGCKA